jgi:hypothetical protein
MVRASHTVGSGMCVLGCGGGGGGGGGVQGATGTHVGQVEAVWCVKQCCAAAANLLSFGLSEGWQSGSGGMSVSADAAAESSS